MIFFVKNLLKFPQNYEKALGIIPFFHMIDMMNFYYLPLLLKEYWNQL